MGTLDFYDVGTQTRFKAKPASIELVQDIRVINKRNKNIGGVPSHALRTKRNGYYVYKIISKTEYNKNLKRFKNVF